MNITNLKIGTRLFILAGFLLLGMALTGLAGWKTLSDMRNIDVETLDKADKLKTSVNTARVAQVEFKKQVQEWKDLLLRGNDPAQFDKYSKAFLTQSKQTQDNLKKLREQFLNLGLDVKLVDEVVATHAELDTRYQVALTKYDVANPESAHIVDKLVKGMDRAPTQKMDVMIAYVLDESKKIMEARVKKSDERYRFGAEAQLAVALASGLLGIVLTFFLVRSIIVPLKTAVQVAEKVAGGDFTVVIDDKHTDETGRLLQSLKTMSASLAEIVGKERRINDQNQAAILRLMNELQAVADGDLTARATVSEDITGAIADTVNYTVEELLNLVTRVTSTAEQVTAASNEAQGVSVTLLNASQQQSREIKDAGQTILTMANDITDVSKSADKSAMVARQSMAAAEQGAQAVQNTIRGMNEIRDQIEETSKRIKRLGESSQEISEITELISDITEQTNVLALNASVQATSAGAAGRGFAVVAEEVQRLAERSGDATKQIGALVRMIQADTHDAVSAMEKSTQGALEGAKLSDAAGIALEEIGRISNQLGELIQGISHATGQQATSANGVAQNIQHILTITEQTQEGTQQTALSIRSLSDLAQELKNSVSRFRVAA